MNNLYIITGGPGMGKTAIIEELAKRGYTSIQETGRHIIQQQLKLNQNGVPWKNKAKFARLMFEQAHHDFKIAPQNNEPVFFDRGIPDVIGYLQLCNIEIPNEMFNVAQECRYNRKVFITPPWKEIYVNDNERKQSFDEAILTYETLKRTYISFSYNLIEVPKASIEERIMFILANI